jgi:hypothetical protein
MAGHAMLKLEETPQERLFRRRERCHVHRALTAAQHRAEGDHQQVMEVVQTGIARPRVLQLLPAGNKLVHGSLPRHVAHAER